MVPSYQIAPALPPAWPAATLAWEALVWEAMVLAMMAPVAAPWAWGLARLAPAPAARARRLGAFGAGYLAVWTAFSLLAAGLDVELAPHRPPDFAAWALIAAGVVQWTPLKRACLRRCRTPISWLLRRGRDRAFEFGWRHGLWCLGCCWALMLTALAAGFMSLAWMAALTGLVLAEQWLPAGEWIARLAGLALVAWGLAILL